MSRKVCAACPFLKKTGMAYDADALEALNSGMTPACHQIVGGDAIFHDENPGPDIVCVGHEKWCDGVTGFEKPLLV